jgi:HSP20 family protein
MALTDPLFRQLSSLAEEMDHMVSRAPGGAASWTPAMDVYETDDDVVVELDAPGIRTEDLSVEAVNGQLVISGERRPRAANRVYRQERWAGRFARTLRLPNGWNGDGISADYRDGVLRLTLKKPEQVKPRRIQIETDASPREIQATAR